MAANKKQRSAQGKRSPKPGAARQSLAQLVGQGLDACRRGDLAEGERLCRRALEEDSGYFDALHVLGIIAFKTQRMKEAAELFAKAAVVRPDSVQAHMSCASALQSLKCYAEALASYEQAIKLCPADAEAYNNAGVALYELKRYEQALTNYDRAIELKACYADAYVNRGNALNALACHEDALASYDRALEISPECVAIHNNRSVALHALKRHEEALASSERALESSPSDAEYLLNHGNALFSLKQCDAALQSYDRSLEIKPDYAQAHLNRGNALRDLKRYDDALTSYGRALECKPAYAEAHLNIGNVLRELKCYEDARVRYDRALEIEPGYADAYLNRGNVLYELKRHDDALASYRCALEIRPEGGFVYGNWLHMKMWICDWTGLPGAVLSLVDKVTLGKEASEPFPILALSDSLPLQRQGAEIWQKNKAPASDSLPVLGKRARGARIRIGYYSADFHNHATAYLMAELFERHDRSRFELIAFSFGPDVKDEMRGRVQAAFDRLIDVSKQPDKDVASLSRSLGVDIAVDLKGFTQDSRPGIFACRAAPIQVNYLGYPGTMGAQYIDYLIADHTLIPEAARQHYSEKIAYLPHSYQVNDSKRPISERVFTRAEAGLPETGFVFCCFNNNYKITPETFDGWMRLLKQVEGSVLWLLEDNASAARNLRQEAQARGVDADRLVFAGRLPLDEHLARHRLADLFLDTLPCNAHTTASDALWAGLPVLTCTGEAFASRVAASLLNAIRLPELITTSQAAYEALAIELATQPERLKALRHKLADNRLTAPLFDTALFTRHIEQAYEQMLERYQADLPAEHLYVLA